jgi:OPA family glycerol-3-phosphate transporter-like MFS transporter
VFLMPFAVMGTFLAISMWNDLPAATRRYIAQCEQNPGPGRLSP